MNLRLVGENLNLMVNTRIQGTEHRRVKEPNLNTRPWKSLKEVQLIDLLPADPTLESLKQR